MKISEIITYTEQSFDLAPGTILEHKRSKTVTEARAVAMYLSRKYTKLSYPEIAERFNRHHSSVIHNCDKIKDLFVQEPNNSTCAVIEKFTIDSISKGLKECQHHMQSLI